MTVEAPPVAPKPERRVHAVLALFRGEPVATVSRQYRIGRSDLYKFRRRALAAMREALNDHPRGPKQPHDRLAPLREERVVALCQRHPTLSSYQVCQRLGPDSPSPRTIQRVRERHGIARLSKRAPPTVPRRVVSTAVKERAAQLIQEKWHLGPECLAWDLWNGEHLAISPSTVKRLRACLKIPSCKPRDPTMPLLPRPHSPATMTAVCPDTPMGASGRQHPAPREESPYAVLASGCFLPLSL